MKYVRCLMLTLAIGLVFLMIASAVSRKAHAERYPATRPFGAGTAYINLSPPSPSPSVKILRVKVLRPAQPIVPRRPVPIPANFNPHGLY